MPNTLQFDLDGAHEESAVNAFMRANPIHTYGYAVGYVTGAAALKSGKQFAGLSADDWRNATDDYAHGYRAAFTHQATK